MKTDNWTSLPDAFDETRKELLVPLFREEAAAGVELVESLKQTGNAPVEIERLLLSRGISRSDLLRSLSQAYSLPFIEYSERLSIPADFLRLLDLEALRREVWCPLTWRGGVCGVATFHPLDENLAAHIRETLKVEHVRFIVALPSDIVRIIENNFDVNPGFPEFSGRTRLAELRTLLAADRVNLARYRTTLAKGRTGLALIRTGVAFISVGLVMLRILGLGYLSILEAVLVLCGFLMAAEGVGWYLPAREIEKENLIYDGTEPTFGTTVLHLSRPGEPGKYCRTAPVENSEKLRAAWNRLTPVMKRRFMAIDRTDLAEERTILASYRTRMARARTGLAFTRTGVSFIGLGVALFRQFHAGAWSTLDAGLFIIGLIMVSEGFHWNFPERGAGEKGFGATKHAAGRVSIWDFMFPPHHGLPASGEQPGPMAVMRENDRGIWGTTGLALERTLIADKRNVKSRLRTIMARSRTGMAFIRTGASIFSVGFGLMVYFGTSSPAWTTFNAILLTLGLGGVIDGLYWHIPAKRLQESFPYSRNDLEIVLADYGKPSSSWKKVVFSHEDI